MFELFEKKKSIDSLEEFVGQLQFKRRLFTIFFYRSDKKYVEKLRHFCEKWKK